MARILGPCDGLSQSTPAGLRIDWNHPAIAGSLPGAAAPTLVNLVPASIASPTTLFYDGTYIYWLDQLESTGRIGRVPVK